MPKPAYMRVPEHTGTGPAELYADGIGGLYKGVFRRALEEYVALSKQRTPTDCFTICSKVHYTQERKTTMDYAQHFNTRATPQTEKADARQVENSAGGFTFQADDWSRLDRFLILGSEGGSYYAGERKLTRENAEVVERCLTANPERTVAKIVEVSAAGRAVKNDPAIFALAMAAGHKTASKSTLANLGMVCRTGTHLFQFCQMVQGFRGWGRGLRLAVVKWYGSKTEAALHYQLCKYQNREGWSHRDVFRKAHPRVNSATYRWVVGGGRPEKYPATGDLPAYLAAFDQLKSADRATTVKLIQEFGFTHEMIATEHKNSVDVWSSLLETMPMTAMVRNLGKMTAVGLLKPMSDAATVVAERLCDAGRIKTARLHPLTLLAALRVYALGHGAKGSLSWEPVHEVTDALDKAFYLSFDAVESTGKRTLIALDVSGSMTGHRPLPGLTCRDISAALAMVTARTEQKWHITAFAHQLCPVHISPAQRLDDVIRVVDRIPMGGTDCALPMLYAAGEDLDVDVFQIFTDNETYAGRPHPHQALRAYREKSGINAKLAVVGMVSNAFSIADPSDPGMLDFVGCDTSTPLALAEFARL